MQNEGVKKYYEILEGKKGYLLAKRLFDFAASAVLSLFLMPLILLIGLMIKIDSPGKIFFLQKRVTTNGRIFKIFKFRTMKENSEKLSGVTIKNDPRAIEPMATALIQEGLYDEALAVVQGAITEQSDNNNLYLLQGIMYNLYLRILCMICKTEL